MNRRTFLGAIPLLGNLPRLCGFKASAMERIPIEGPCFFKTCSFDGRREHLAYADVWSSEFRENCLQQIRRFVLEEGRVSPPSSCTCGPTPTWNITRARYEREMDWVSFIRQLPADAPGKIRYVDFILNRHKSDFTSINRYYSSHAKSRPDLMSFPFIKVSWDSPIVYRDDQAFLAIIARKLSKDLTRVFQEESSIRLPFAPEFGVKQNRWPGNILGLRIPVQLS